ncbi:hypothetical protein ACH4UM_40910 [Streptomyces sp. NPDC020801]|uniref:hypothetical protein n=1 Tax=unclassified Streptomyces TaxID=2593676 RepID=UPI00379CD08F
MTAHTSEKPLVQRAETGWARARRVRKEGLRTCVPALEDCGGTDRDHTGPEWNIVRGED